jgi:hypothetical protein
MQRMQGRRHYRSYLTRPAYLGLDSACFVPPKEEEEKERKRKKGKKKKL